MSDIETLARELAEELKKHDADYIEARLEESQTSHITYRGRELESIGRAADRRGQRAGPGEGRLGLCQLQ